MSRLSILLLGDPRVCFGSQQRLHFPTEKALELLAMTAVSPGDRISRDRIATALHDDMAAAQSRRALSTDLWRLRRSLSDAGADSDDYLYADRKVIGFRRSAPVYVDVKAFRSTAEPALRDGSDAMDAEAAARLTQAVALYRDDFLSNLDREWCLVLRENLRAKYTACLDLLLAFEMKADAWQRALHWAERLIALDPLLEHAHRAAMQSHFLMGNRGAAIRQYSECAAVLDRELGVEPAKETQRMYRALVSVPVPNAARAESPAVGDAFSGPGTSASGEPELRRPLTDRLSMALGSLNTARRLIEDVDADLRRGDRR